ncbi:MAG: hypothetical protein GX453_10005 [Lactococcus chungangensis]|uniref:Adenylyl/Guanylyl and SMODS C-terminal sensor domain-containing protein n=1 Tax=Pseudolactococcus chungangensis TaxID=451457 RepID=A0A847J6V7_9LACT|nr:hypothetical protein [Lactococcus chungangensis]
MNIKFHYLNVGHGDTTVVELPDGKTMVIDLNRSREFDDDTAKELAESLNISTENYNVNKSQILNSIQAAYDIVLDDPVEYLLDLFPTKEIYRYIQTHPDIDHMAGFKTLVDNFIIYCFWDTDHKNIVKTDFLNDGDKADWEKYLEFRKNSKICFYRSTNTISNKDNPYPYNLYVFHPTQEALDVGDTDKNPQPNLFSYLILIEYNGFKTVLGGDVPSEYWKDLWDWLNKNAKAKELFKNISVLKASHHGRESGRCGWQEGNVFKRDFLDWMNPDFVVVSVGKKPKTDSTNWYRQRSDGSYRNVLTTRWWGTIWLSYENTDDVFDRKAVTLATRYDRKDDSSIKENLNTPTKKTNYSFSIGAKLSTIKNGDYNERYKSNGRFLPKNMWLKFFITNSNIPEPYSIVWRVLNTGQEARDAHQERGNLEPDVASKSKIEHTQYRGTHYVEAFAIKDNYCVARDRFYVNIR